MFLWIAVSYFCDHRRTSVGLLHVELTVMLFKCLQRTRDQILEREVKKKKKNLHALNGVVSLKL